MLRIFQSLAKSRKFVRRALALAFACSLFPLPSSLLYATEVTFPKCNVKLTYENAEQPTFPDGDMGDIVFVFKADGSLTLPSYAKAWILSVGGGGAGGTVARSSNDTGMGGGGGAGGFVEQKDEILNGGTYTITVGAGGEAGTAKTKSVGDDGKPSFIEFNGAEIPAYTAAGGGGGGAESAGSAGGSGGGGSWEATKQDRDGGAGSQGSAGGQALHNKAAGGGGGAGGEGGPTTKSGASGAGGVGLPSKITLSLTAPDDKAVYYAGGGSGGQASGTAPGGDDDGFGKGGGGRGGGGRGGADEATQGTNGLGGGGGGGTHATAGAAGGSGVVIIRISEALPGDPVKPKAPTESPRYTGEGIVVVQPSLAYKTLTGGCATNAGSYHCSVELKDGFKWSDGTADAVEFDWEIKPKELTPPADGVSFTYDGEMKFAIPTPDPGFAFVGLGTGNNCTNAIDAADYCYTVKPKDNNYVWKDAAEGEERVEKTIDWSITPKLIDQPTVPTLTFNGENQVAISDPNPVFVFIGLGTDNNCTNAVHGGEYYYQVGLKSTNYAWKDAEEGKEHEALTVDWSIDPKPVAPPTVYTDLVYSGEWQDALDTDFDRSVYDFTDDSTYQALDAGSYTFTLVLKNELGYDYCWSDGSYSGEKLFPWSIARAPNEVTEFSIIGWKVGTAPRTPTFHSLFGESTVLYRWCNREDAPVEEWADFTTNPPTEAGSYWLWAYVAETKNWVVAQARQPFSLWDDPELIFTDFVEIRVENASGNDYVDYPLELTFAEDSPAGFTYDRAGADGKSLLFVNEDGSKQLPYVVDDWATDGKSKVVVYLDELPKAGTTIRLYWHVQEGAEPPAPAPIPEHPATESPLVTSSYGEVHRDGLKVDRWSVVPSLSPTEWDYVEGGEQPLTVAGELASGAAVTKVYFNIYTPNETNDLSEAGKATNGVYLAVFYNNSRDDYEPISAAVQFVVVGHTPSMDITGNKGDSGRVLLMNNDKGDGARKPIDYQGWYDADASGAKKSNTSTFWQFLGDDAYVDETYNLKAGTNCVLWTANYGRRLWQLVNCRHGNTYNKGDRAAPTGTPTMNDTQNYLPWSLTSFSIDSHGTRTAQAGQVGQVVMRNVEGAAIYSTFFTDGVGTIYFDAVNGWNTPVVEGSPAYEIVVEVSTNALDDATLIPESDWTAVKMYPVHVKGATLTAPTPTEKFNLAVTGGGAKDEFYRIYVPVNYRESDGEGLRFRIRRASISSEYAKNPDGKALILIDNVLVSYPPMGAKLVSAGAPDWSRTGTETLGWEGATCTPYPSAGAKDVLGRAVPVYFLGAGDDSADPTRFVMSAKMHYRWRYLDQLNAEKTPWSSVNLNPADGYRAMEPLVLPAQAGDVEYWFEARVQAPFFSYKDYSGTGVELKGPDGKPLYTEEMSTTRGAYEPAEGERLPSQGKDWFFRLREGASDYRSMRVVAERKGPKDVWLPHDVATLGVVGDSSWRGYLKTPDPIEGGLRIRLEGLSPRGEAVTNFWCTVTDVEEIPKSYEVEPCRANEGRMVPCESRTGHLSFQFDERTRTLTIARADYQDFNHWSMAVTNLFVGSSVEKNYAASQVGETNVDWTAWTASVATNVDWREDFKVGEGERADTVYPKNKPFANAFSRHGWTVENALWTYGKWTHESWNADGGKSIGTYGDDSAVQLEGRGKGRLAFINQTSVPSGLDSVALTLRLAQFTDFDSFNFWNKTDVTIDWIQQKYELVYASQMQNYTFVTYGSLSDAGGDDYSGDGTISLAGYFTTDGGCYEARFSRGSKDTNLRIRLLRWKSDGLKMNFEDLGFKEFELTDNKKAVDVLFGTAVQTGALFLSLGNESNGTLVQAGVMTSQAILTQKPDLGMKDKDFWCVSYLDASKARLTHGAFGVQSANCHAYLRQPSYWTLPVEADTKTPPIADTIVQSTREKLPFNGDYKYDAGIAGQSFDDYFKYWMERPGRLKEIRVPGSPNVVGFESNVAITNLLEIQTATHGKSDWSPLSVTNVVTSFRDVTVTNVVHDRKTCDVRFLVLGQPSDVRTDVVINDVELTQWCGQETPGLEGSQSYARCNEFVYTCGWLETRVPAEKGKPLQLALQPARAKDETAPLSLRSPLLQGVGLIHFSWKDADPRCKLHLQICEDDDYYTLRSMLVNRTREKPDSESWTTLKTWNFANPETPRAGSDTVYINHRAPKAAVLRLVIDGQVVAEALDSEASKDNPFYGGIRITDAYVWDLPAYDSSCWSAWNMRAEGWENGKPTKYAYIADYDRGYSGLLNNTLDASTLADTKPEHFKQNPPYVQSPTFETNCIGEVIFRARLYDVPKKGNPAVVTCYGATQLDETSLEPTNWVEVAGGSVEIDATTYRTYSVKFKASDSFYALRFAVKGVPGVLGEPGQDPVYDPPARVALDSICVLEQAQPAVRFRKLHVRPFRNAGLMKTTAMVPEDLITSPDEQPLLGETFGFQAELELEMNAPDDIRTDDPRHPITVELHVYPAKEPWGYENWKDLPEARHAVLVTADGTNLVFRSTLSRPDTVARPLFKQDVGDYGVVQYHMVARYYDKAGEQLKHELSAKDWTMPSWYRGLPDPNAKAGAKFSAFTLLDEVSPDRVWINEINFVESAKDKSTARQWIELAVPQGVDLTGWEVYACSLDSATSTKGTGYEGDEPLVRIGKGNCKTASKRTGDAQSHYAFLTIGAPKASAVVTDGRWNSLDGTKIKAGALDWVYPYGFELRRPSGIIEHRVVAEGDASQYKDYWYGYQYTGTNLVRALNEFTTRKGTGAGWVFAGADPVKDNWGLSVVKGHGAETEDWAVRLLTLGLINETQVIPPDWYVPPQGDYVWVYLNCLNPHVRQLLNGVVSTNEVLTLNAGGATNVTYEVDNFYELADLAVESEHALHKLTGPVRRNGRNYWDLYIYDISNRVDVSASADVEKRLRDGGVTADNPYRPAIMKWLEGGFTRDKNGQLVPFAGDTVHDFIYRYPAPTADGTETTNLSVKVAYWLDVDITQEGWELQGGMGDTRGGALGPVCGAIKRQRPGEALIHTNRFGTMWMMLTNRVTGAAHQPWRLQGLGNERSDDLSTYAAAGWTSVTFKVTGKLIKSYSPDRIVTRPLRYFVFTPQSFRAPDDPLAPFSAKVEIVDPFSKQSPASDWNWAPWWQSPVGIGWGLDDALTPAGVSEMLYEDLLENYGPEIP